MAKSFTRGGYSFRSFTYANTGAAGFHVFPKGERAWPGMLASLYAGTDGMSWVIDMNRYVTDARPSFQEACDLVMARLPMGNR